MQNQAEKILELVKKKADIIHIKATKGTNGLQTANNGVVSEIPLNQPPDLKDMQQLVGGMIEGVRIGNNVIANDYYMYCNEEGKINEEPVNFVATAIHNGGDVIVGDVMLILKKWDE